MLRIIKYIILELAIRFVNLFFCEYLIFQMIFFDEFV
jgi:hypothetical protein